MLVVYDPKTDTFAIRDSSRQWHSNLDAAAALDVAIDETNSLHDARRALADARRIARMRTIQVDYIPTAKGRRKWQVRGSAYADAYLQTRAGVELLLVDENNLSAIEARHTTRIVKLLAEREKC